MKTTTKKMPSRPASASQNKKSGTASEQGKQGVQSQTNVKAKPDEPEITDVPNVKKTVAVTKANKISNVVTKFSFATKGGIAAHNPYKTN